MNGAGPLWVVGWLAAAIIIGTAAGGVLTALGRILDRREARRDTEDRLDAESAWLATPGGEEWHASHTAETAP